MIARDYNSENPSQSGRELVGPDTSGKGKSADAPRETQRSENSTRTFAPRTAVLYVPADEWENSLKRFRKTWLRGNRCLEEINNFWMAHKPQTMSEVYAHLHEELRLRLDEAARVGYGFTWPTLPPAAARLSRSCSKIVQWKLQRK